MHQNKKQTLIYSDVKRYLCIGFLLIVTILSQMPLRAIQAQEVTYPYAVPEIGETIGFNFWGDVAPISVSLVPNATDSSTATLIYQYHSDNFPRYTYQVGISQRDTQAITVTDYYGEERTINANTVISPLNTTGQNTLDDLYLFRNYNGSLAFALTIPDYLATESTSDKYYELVQSSGEIVLSEFPITYAVANDDITNRYYFDHINMPDYIDISLDDETNNTGTVTYKVGQQTVTYQAVFSTVPITQFRIASTLSDVEPIRPIRANTLIQLSNPSTDELPADLASNLYLFYNIQGGVSLATPLYSSTRDMTLFDIKAEAIPR